MFTPCSVCFLIWAIICGVEAAQQLYEGDVCAADGSKCENLRNCTILLDDVNKGKKPELCGFKDKDVIVCCSSDLLFKFSESKQPVSVDACQWYRDEVCSSGRSPAVDLEAPINNLEENLPFMAMIGYGSKLKISWRCAGVLISRKYVLAPAQCSKPWNLGSASWVRFKNHDISNASNIYKIAVRFDHPGYKPPALYNNIALYRLDKSVTFSMVVRPICLPQVFSDYESNIYMYGTGYVVKNKKFEFRTSELKMIPPGSCAFAGNVQQLPNGTDGPNSLCVTGYDGGNPVDCTKNFVGGAFFTKDFSKCESGILLGLYTIGKLCNGMDITGAYTNVSHFTPWVESIVWPENNTYPEIVWQF